MSTLFRKWVGTDLIGTYIHRILVIDMIVLTLLKSLR